MEKFIPYEKLSKKKKRELDAKRRGTWAIDPTVRKPPNPKAYNRRAAQKGRDDDPISVPVSFWRQFAVLQAQRREKYGLWEKLTGK